VYTSVWSGRVWNAKHFDKLPLAFSWNQGLLEPEWWVILKGSKNRDVALKFIAFASAPKPQADMARAFGVGPTNPKALELLDQTLATEMPTAPANLAKQVFVNGQWWVENRSKVMDRWNKWLLQ
jgi:putative spermidine/putrescine transport system substrate-binding protein